VADADLAGYQVFCADYHPSQYRGYGLDRMNSPADSNQPYAALLTAKATDPDAGGLYGETSVTILINPPVPVGLSGWAVFQALRFATTMASVDATSPSRSFCHHHY